MEVEVAHVARIGASAQGLDQDVGDAGDAAQVDVAMGGDVTDRLVGGNVLDRLHVEDYCYFCKRKCSKYFHAYQRRKTRRLRAAARYDGRPAGEVPLERRADHGDHPPDDGGRGL